MPIFKRTFVAAGAIAAGMATSQAPEFSQQYRQRIGGAVDEMKTVIADFDRDAAANGLDRSQALQTYARSNENFLQDRGLSMQSAIDRLNRLLAQQGFMERLGPLGRPIAVFQSPDIKIAERAWEDFEPAIPITTHGIAWGAMGLFLGWVMMRLVLWPFGRRKSKAKRPKIEPRGPLSLSDAIAQAKKHQDS